MNRRRIVGASTMLLIMILVHFGIEGLAVAFPKLGSLTLTMLMQGMFLLIAVLYITVIEKENFFRFIRFQKFRLWSVFLIPVFLGLCMPTLMLVNSISMLVFTNDTTTAIQGMFGDNVLLGLVSVAVVPALVEEVVFRGAIYNSLRGARPLRAIIISGLLFGAMHMNFNQFMYAAFLGIMMGFLFEATGSILSTMILHFCMNGNSVLLMWMLPKMQEFLEKINPAQAVALDTTNASLSASELLPMIMVLIPVAAITLGLAFLLLMGIAALNKRLDYIKFMVFPKCKEERKNLPKPKMVNIPMVVDFILCFVVCILIELLNQGVL